MSLDKSELLTVDGNNFFFKFSGLAKVQFDIISVLKRLGENCNVSIKWLREKIKTPENIVRVNKIHIK